MRMLGRKTWFGLPCFCCNGPRSVRVEKVREDRAWRSEWVDDLAEVDTTEAEFDQAMAAGEPAHIREA